MIKPTAMQSDFKAKLVYPDPTMPAGLEFELPDEATVTIEIFDESGKSVQSVFSETQMKSGKHVLRFDKFGLKDGEYIIRLLIVIRGEEYRMTKNIQIETVENTKREI